ncbi:MAG: helix-turn-helix transcriptional regulator, partial [Ktedonobacteraceae bacterium]
MTRRYAIPNELLRFERERRNWKLEDVAGRIGVVDYGLVGKWERGDASPGHQYRQKICEVFGKTAKELWLDKEDNPYWFMPHHRNDLFTGREELLGDIHKKFAASGSASTVFPLAIRGLAGMGKTQTAIEYTYRYRQEYHTVLWVRAHSPELLVTDFAKIATVLKLPENTEKDQMLVIDAVKNWLSRFTYWLLLLDNVEDMSSVSDFLPSTKKGHILLTTRSQATMPIAKPIDLDRMKPEEGTLFLLRRTGFIPQNGTLDDVSHANRTKATKVANVMDGLPLALDQVGAYIEETKCGLLNYLSLYDKKKGALLKWRGAVTKEHPESVYSTFLLSFTAVEKSSGIASDLLRVLAFLASDDIPEEIITGGAPDLGPTLQALVDPYTFDTSIEILSRYSLIQRNADMKRLSIHRLVQEVLKEGMEEGIQRQWIERIVRAVNRVFPDVEFATWPECQRYLPHALICANLIERWEIAFPEAARLLDQLGLYLKELAQYQQAEPLLQRALAIREHTLGTEHPSTATSFDNLAELYHEQGQYLRAAPLYQRALAIREGVLGAEHPSTATSLNNLARLFHDQRYYSKAEPLFLRSLTIYENILGSEDAFTATCLNNLAGLYLEQGEYRKAEPLLRRALAIQEKRLGKEHP